MILTDVHTHSAFSHDGDSSLYEMVAAAKQKKLAYFGVSEHFDFDCISFGVTIHGETMTQTTDAHAYFAEGRALQKVFCEKNFHFLVGGEYGYADDGRCFEAYSKLNETYSPDFVVNSVHTYGKYDAYDKEYFTGLDKRSAYLRYFDCVRKSLDAPYRYDIVGHLGYVSRKAPYPDRKLRYADFQDVLDDILKTIADKGKILEVNSSVSGAESEFLPDADILTRYYQLGGRKISFASDAHTVLRIAENRAAAVNALKEIGFSCLTVPVREHEEISIPLDE